MPEQESQPRQWLYSPDCPEGRIYEGAEAIAAAEADGWVRFPAGHPDAPKAPEPKAKGGKGKAASDNSE